MHTYILMLAAKAVPILALIFVISLLVYKLYINVRSRFDISVNCWFCNGDTRVPFSQRNSWTCPSCEQYNGFNADGDYNRDIFSQRDCSNASDPDSSGDSSRRAKSVICANSYYANGLTCQQPPVENGLCKVCNEAQRLKIEKLAQFEPRHESFYEHELKLYKKELEQKFQLCSTCERHVNKVLHEKKKMVLGSKFLNFIMKGAALLKQPHFQRLARAQQQRRLARYQLLMKVFTVLNIICLMCSLPTATREQFNGMLGELPSKPIYFVYSHALTMLHLLVDSVGGLLSEQPYAAKFVMFASTLGKLLVYSVGMSPAQAAHATFSSCYTSIYPYAMLALSFVCNLVDGLKFTRFTVMIVLWSVYAKGSMLLFEAIDGVTFILLGSVVTLVLLTTKRSNRLQQMSTGDSFHRLCADECISDDETISMLSQQLSCNASNNTNNMSLPDQSRCNSPLCISPRPQPRNRNLHSNHINHNTNNSLAAPSVLSLDSLHLSTQRTNKNCMLPTSPAPGTAYSTYAASRWEQPAWSRNYAMELDGCASVGQPNGWSRGGPCYQMGLEPRRAAYEFGVEQRPMMRSPSNLLFPSRLKMQQQQRNGDISAWVDATSGSQQPDLLQVPTTANLMQCGLSQELSRTSSQSSGFESQPGHNNQPRQEFQPFWGPRTATEELQQEQQLLDYAWSEQRSTRVPPPSMSSPCTRQSELGRTVASGQGQVDYRTGDLLRKWMDRNGDATQKANG